MEKRGFGAGKYNGVGGKIEKNETPEQAFQRLMGKPFDPEKYDLRVGEGAMDDFIDLNLPQNSLRKNSHRGYDNNPW